FRHEGRRAVRLQAVAVDQVVGRVTDEGVAAELGREAVGEVDHRAAPGRDVAAGHLLRGGPIAVPGVGDAAGGALDPPGLEGADPVDLAGGAVVGDVE